MDMVRNIWINITIRVSLKMTIFIRKDITIIFNKSINGRETGLKVNRIGKGNLQIKILFIRETLIKISLRVQEL